MVWTTDYRDQMTWLVSWGWTSLGFQVLSLLSGLSYVVEILIVLLLLIAIIIWLLTHRHCKIIGHITCLPHAFVPQARFPSTFFPWSNRVTSTTTWLLHHFLLTHRWFDLSIKRVELIWNVMIHLILHHVLTNDLSTCRVLLLGTGDQTFDSLTDPVLSRIVVLGLDSCNHCLILLLWFGSSCTGWKITFG